MRIGIDGTHWSNQRGYGRYARGLITAVLQQPHGHDYILFVDTHTHDHAPLPTTIEIVTVQTRSAQAASENERRSVGDMLAMGARVGRADLDVMVYPSVYTYFPALTRAVRLVGIHDVIPEKYPALIFPSGKGQLAWTAKSMLARLQADALLTVSEYAKREIVKIFNWRADRTYVVGEAPDPAFMPITDPVRIDAARDQAGVPRSARYFVYLGGVNPHKNVIALLRAFIEVSARDAMRDLHLVLIGPQSNDVFTAGIGAAKSEAERLGALERIHFTDFLPDEQVALLLNGAVALILPSLEEGYGLPGIEAAACGTPVIGTINSALPDVLEGGGIFFDPRQPDALRAAMVDLLSDPARRDTLGQMALTRARALTWQNAAAQFDAVVTAITQARGKRIR